MLDNYSVALVNIKLGQAVTEASGSLGQAAAVARAGADVSCIG